MKITRNQFLWIISFLLVSFTFQFFRLFNFFFPESALAHRYVRPPGAKVESEFVKECIRCRACANVCQAGCIRFFSFAENRQLAGTPYLNTRLRSCNLCMNCTQVCPSGALSPINRDLEEISEKVHMGTAVVLETNCLSYNGRICGICHDACPLKGSAITLIPRAKPVVHEDYCIGCGRCEERCPQSPTAIYVKPPEGNYAS